MTDDNSFLLNTWYVAALSNEVHPETLMNRLILNRPILLFRKSDGTPIAMEDRCPHRFLPLHIGKKEGDNITCHYHGLQFNHLGKCIFSPHGSGQIPNSATVPVFPIEEKFGFIWIWLGEKDKVRTEDIMDCSYLDKTPASAKGYTYMHNHANYQLLSDNILDLTHIDHVHGPLINTHGKLSPLIPQVKERDKSVTVRWDWEADIAMLLLAEHLPNPDSNANQFFQVEWHPAATMHLQVGAVQGSDDYDNDGVVLYDYHIMTPETENTTHYFFATTRNYKRDDSEYNDKHLTGIREAFVNEDKPVIEAQQQAMGNRDFWELEPILVSSDAGAIRARRKLKSLISAQNSK